MGIWAQTSLDNDTATDFIGRMADEAADWGMTADALAGVILMEAIHGEPHQETMLEGLAAAEVMASALGRPTGSGFLSSQEKIALWVKSHPLPDKSLLPEIARVAASRFIDESQKPQTTLYPGADTATWTQSFDSLRARLEAKPGDPGLSEKPTAEEFALLWQDLAAMSPDAALALYTATDDEVLADISEKTFKSLLSGQAWRSRAAKVAWSRNHPSVRSR